MGEGKQPQLTSSALDSRLSSCKAQSPSSLTHLQGSLQSKVTILSRYKIIKVGFPTEQLLCVQFSDAYWASRPALGTFPPLSSSPSILPFSCCIVKGTEY